MSARWSEAEVEARQEAVAEAATDDFRELLRAAGLDPAKDLRFFDWSGMDFSSCDLTGCDFTGANLDGCRFEGALLYGPALGSRMGAASASPEARRKLSDDEVKKTFTFPAFPRFDRARMDRAALRAAADWEAFSHPSRWARAAARPTTRHLPDLATFSDAPFAPEMVVIPEGEFLMGSTPEEQARFELLDEWRKTESPRHLVRIDRRFAIGRYPVTFDEYDAFCDATDRKRSGGESWGRGRRPVINVSWNDAVAYCNWLSETTGAEYRLPSEAEWEYACRAGTDTAFPWSDDWNPSNANGAEGGPRKTTEVGAYPPNGFGLSDMTGNVWEWCADDWFDSYATPRVQPPLLSKSRANARRVLRGGSWNFYPGDLRSAYRDWDGPDFRFSWLGFRPSRTLLTS